MTFHHIHICQYAYLLQVSPDDFFRVFGAPIEHASSLIESKALTISKLLTIAPPGTLDPTPHLYARLILFMKITLIFVF